MSFDRQDFENLRKEKASQRLRSGSTMTLVHAAPPLEKLTTSPEWNKFLELVAGRLEEKQKVQAYHAQQLTHPGLVSHDDLMKVKLQLVMATAAVQELELVMALPQTILTAAAEAAKQL